MRIDEVANQARGPLEVLEARYAWHPVIANGGSEQLDHLVVAVGISGADWAIV